MKYAVVKENCGVYEFTKWHDSLDSAMGEAEILCRKTRITFYILELKHKCYIKTTPVTWEEIK